MADLPPTFQPLTEFHLFLALPAELRLKIYSFILSVPRLVDISHYCQQAGHRMQPSINFDLSQKLSEFIYFPNCIPEVMPRALIEHIYAAPSPIPLLAVSKESREYALKGVNFEFEADVPNPLSSWYNKSILEDLRGVASYWETRNVDVDIPTLRIQVGKKVPECITRLRFEIDVVFIDTRQFWILEQWLPEFFFQGVRYLAMLFETWLGTGKEILKFTGLKELILFAEPSRCMWPTRDLKQDQTSRLEYMEESTPKRLEELTRLDPTWSKPRLITFSDIETFIRASQ